MSEQYLKISILEAKHIFIRSFYSISRQLMTFCENNHVLLSEDQIIETYCYFMNGLVKDNFDEAQARKLIDAIDARIRKKVYQGCQLAELLKRAEKAYFDEIECLSNPAPEAKNIIFSQMHLNQKLLQADVHIAESILMVHWDRLETIETVLAYTKAKNQQYSIDDESLSWFLNQHLPIVFIDTLQKTGASKDYFLLLYQKELTDWLSWLIGFYSTLQEKNFEEEITQKIFLLKNDCMEEAIS